MTTQNTIQLPMIGTIVQNGFPSVSVEEVASENGSGDTDGCPVVAETTVDTRVMEGPELVLRETERSATGDVEGSSLGANVGSKVGVRVGVNVGKAVRLSVG